MIKIKNYIFNENRIVQMCINENNNLEIDTDNGFPIVIKDVKFDDIKWEYDRFKVETDKDEVIFANRILEKKIKQLERENKNLKDGKHIWYEHFKQNQHIINKAIKYIKINTYSVYDKKTTIYEDVVLVDKLLNILKGGE